MEYVDLFQQRLDQLYVGCIVCLVGNTVTPRHPLPACPTLRLIDNQGCKLFFDWKKKIKYAPGKACFACHVPQGPNDSLHGTFSAKRTNCKYSDLLAPLGFAIYHSEPLREQAQRHFNTIWHSADGFVAWLNGPVQPGHFTNLSAIMMWFASLTGN
jgi:hypothetical protein